MKNDCPQPSEGGESEPAGSGLHVSEILNERQKKGGVSNGKKDKEGNLEQNIS